MNQIFLKVLQQEPYIAAVCTKLCAICITTLQCGCVATIKFMFTKNHNDMPFLSQKWP